MKYRFFKHGRLVPARTTSSIVSKLAVTVLAAMVWLTAGVANARSGGFVSEGCSGCHRGGPIPKITITPATMTPMLGQVLRLTVTIDVGSARGAGFYIGATSGKLSPVSGEKTKVGGEGVTHNGTNTASGGKVVFHADWTVPATPGGVDFKAAAIAADMNGNSGGDGASTAFLAFAYGCSTSMTYYRDFDGDGMGYSAEEYTRSCGKPDGYGEAAGDCDDNDPKIHPGSKEVCNRRDDNCDGKTDEGLESVVLYPDSDGDGWGRRTTPEMVMMGCGMAKGWGIEGNDCDDNDKAVFPDAPEICNLKDDDCDGRVDEGARADCGVGWCRRLAAACDNASCTPGKPQKERCNLLDDDCDGEVDEDPDSLCGAGLTCRDAKCVDSGTAPPPPDPVAVANGTAGGNNAVDGGAQSTAGSGTGGIDGNGEPQLANAGCRVARSNTHQGGLALLGLAAVWVFSLRRKRRTKL
jgi:hypothetical protein